MDPKYLETHLTSTRQLPYEGKDPSVPTPMLS